MGRMMMKPGMKSLMRALAVAGAGLSLAAPAVGGAQDAPLSAFSVTYDAKARGITAINATYSYTFANGRYQANATHRAVGIVRSMVKNRQDYTYSVSGVIDENGQPRPRAYRHQGGGKNRVVNVSFSDAAVVTTANPPMGMGEPPATPAQKLNTVDQVTMLAQMLMAEGDPCRQRVRVFLEGRVRFDLVMSPRGTQAVNLTGFRGNAVRCTVRLVPIAGFSDPIEATNLTFLFAPINGYFAPVQIQMPTEDAGIVTLEARRVTVTGRR
jgi:hypothetical protein